MPELENLLARPGSSPSVWLEAILNSTDRVQVVEEDPEPYEGFDTIELLKLQFTEGTNLNLPYRALAIEPPDGGKPPIGHYHYFMSVDDLRIQLAQIVEIELQERAELPDDATDTPAQGVSLYDAVLFVEDGDEVAARKLIRRWDGSKKTRGIKKIGKCPKDNRRKLSELTDVLQIVSKILSLEPSDRKPLKTHLQTKLRYPEQ